MALTKIGTDGIKDDAVTSDKVANAINSSIAANTAKDLTALSASNLTSGTIPDARLPATLPAISGANLTNLPASGKATNIIVNGDLRVAQRFTGPNEANGFGTVDRFSVEYSGADNDPSQAQIDVASGTTPYTLGFRKALKVINGNQTSGAGTSDRVTIGYKIEAQDLANSGWNYASSSSYITFSYWVKSSVAQNFYNTFGTDDGTKQRYTTETGSLSADTWTKITKTIPGNSNLTFNNDTGEGLEITWELFRGTDQTGTRPLNAWAAADNATRTPDQTSTWWTTNDATWELTGVQLEVGSQATAFEHRTYGDELSLCQRYFIMFTGNVTAWRLGHSWVSSATGSYCLFHLPNTMRNIPSQIYTTGTAANYQVQGASSANAAGTQIINCNAVPTIHSQSTRNLIQLVTNTAGSLITGRAAWFRSSASTVYIGIGAELA